LPHGCIEKLTFKYINIIKIRRIDLNRVLRLYIVAPIAHLAVWRLTTHIWVVPHR